MKINLKKNAVVNRKQKSHLHQNMVAVWAWKHRYTPYNPARCSAKNPIAFFQTMSLLKLQSVPISVGSFPAALTFPPFAVVDSRFPIAAMICEQSEKSVKTEFAAFKFRANLSETRAGSGRISRGFCGGVDRRKQERA